MSFKAIFFSVNIMWHFNGIFCQNATLLNEFLKVINSKSLDLVIPQDIHKDTVYRAVKDEVYKKVYAKWYDSSEDINPIFFKTTVVVWSDLFNKSAKIFLSNWNVGNNYPVFILNINRHKNITTFPVCNINQEVYFIQSVNSVKKVNISEYYHVNNFTISNSKMIELSKKAIASFSKDFFLRRSNFFGSKLKYL